MSAPDRPIDVFVIHVAADAPRAAALSAALRAHGLRPFSDQDLKPGDLWDTVLPAAMTRARALAVVISTHWPRAGEPGKPWYGPDEVARAIDLARTVEPPPRLIPIWIDGAVDRTPYGLRRVSGIHVTGHAFADAAADIAGILDPTVTDGPPQPRTGVDAARERLARLRADGANAETLAAATEDVKQARRAARDGPAPRAGDVFADRYRLLDRLGDGGFATVWRAKDLRTDARVALKILHGRWSHDRSRVERFCRGAERMAALDHPSVVRVLAKPSTHLGWHFYVMECLACDLHAARTRAESPLSARQAVEAVLTVADALAVAHARGMVHRDVKPQNILLDEWGRAKLTDFDLVRADDSTGGTRTGALGTFLFAAPEALAAGKDATPATDVYGLGVCTIFALCGRVPSDVVRAPERVIAALDAPARVKAALRRALDWDAERRPPDAGAFAAELRASLAPMAADPPRPSRSLGFIVELLLILSLLGVGAWGLVGGDDEAQTAAADAPGRLKVGDPIPTVTAERMVAIVSKADTGTAEVEKGAEVSESDAGDDNGRDEEGVASERRRPVRRYTKIGGHNGQDGTVAKPSRASKRVKARSRDDLADQKVARVPSILPEDLPEPDSRAPSERKPEPESGPPPLPEKLTRRQVLTVIRHNARRIVSCSDGTDFSGVVPCELVVDRDGRVTEARVLSGPQRDTPIGACLERTSRSFRFPQFSGEPMRLVLPFTL